MRRLKYSRRWSRVLINRQRPEILMCSGCRKRCNDWKEKESVQIMAVGEGEMSRVSHRASHALVLAQMTQEECHKILAVLTIWSQSGTKCWNKLVPTNMATPQTTVNSSSTCSLCNAMARCPKLEAKRGSKSGKRLSSWTAFSKTNETKFPSKNCNRSTTRCTRATWTGSVIHPCATDLAAFTEFWDKDQVMGLHRPTKTPLDLFLTLSNQSEKVSEAQIESN